VESLISTPDDWGLHSPPPLQYQECWLLMTLLWKRSLHLLFGDRPQPLWWCRYVCAQPTCFKVRWLFGAILAPWLPTDELRLWLQMHRTLQVLPPDLLLIVDHKSDPSHLPAYMFLFEILLPVTWPKMVMFHVLANSQWKRAGEEDRVFQGSFQTNLEKILVCRLST
jgi:hypothetical protein